MSKGTWFLVAVAGVAAIGSFMASTSPDPIAECTTRQHSTWAAYPAGSEARAVAYARTAALCEAGLRERGEI